MPTNDPDDWSAYRMLVVDSLKTIREGVAKLEERVRGLELQAAKYGAISGIVATGIVELIKYALTKGQAP